MSFQTYNNWLKFGYNFNPDIGKRMSRTDHFFVELEPFSTEILKPLRDAFEYNNKKIQEKSNGSPIYVLLSGGYDSQSIAKTMKEDGIPFIGLIFDFGRSINEFDVNTAVQLCKDYQIDYQVVCFDLIDFYENKQYEDYAKVTHCNNQFTYSYMRGLRDIQGFIVSGHGDQEFYFINNEKFWKFSEQNFCLYTYANHIGLNGYVRYHEFTKELWYSTYTKIWQRLTHTNQEETYKLKSELFNLVGLKSRNKFTGFEPYAWPNKTYENIRHRVHVDLINRYPSSENDIENLYAGKPPGDIYYVKTTSFIV